MSESQNVQVSFTSDTGNLDAGTQAAAASVETAATEITSSLDGMAAQAKTAAAATTEALEEASVEGGGFLSKLSERVRITGESFESLHASLSVFGDAFTAFGELALAGLGLEKVAEGIGDVAETGEKLNKLSEETGLTTEQLSGLRVMAIQTGTDFDQFTTLLQRLPSVMQEAAINPAGKAGAAFKAMGISVVDTKTGALEPISQILDEVSAKLASYADGASKTALETDIFGQRIGANLLPMLNQLGQVGLYGAIEKSNELGQTWSGEDAEAATHFEDDLHRVGLGIEGMAASIIKFAIPALDQLAQAFSLATGTASLSEQIASVQAQITIAQNNRGRFSTAAELPSLEDKLKDLQKQQDDLSASLKSQSALTGGAPPGTVTPPNVPDKPPKGASGGDDGGVAAAKKTAAQETQIDQDQADEEQQIAAAQYEGQVDIWDAEVAQNKITKAQEIEDEIGAANQKYQSDLSAAQQKAALYQQGTAAYQKALDDELLLEAQHNDAILKLDAQLAQAQEEQAKKVADAQKAYADQITKDYEAAFRPVDQAFSSTVSGIIQGTETLRQGVDKALQSILLSVIDDTEKMLTHWAAMELGKLAATANSQAGIESINAQGEAVSAASDIKQIENAAARAAAGAYAAVAGIPYIGPFLAPAAAAAAFAGVMAFDVISAAGGAGSIESDGTLGILHANEMVLPASIATPLRANLANAGGVGGGGTAQTNNLHFSPTINGGASGSMTPAVLGSMLNQFSTTMFSTFENWFSNNGALTLPGRGN